MQNDTLIGYRLVRLIGSGPRAEVFLAVPGSGEGGPVALKVPLPGTSEASMLIEAEALDRAAGEHVVGLHDLATGPLGTPVLVLSRIPGPSLAQLLARRGPLTAGEAITVLVPVHAALTRVHASGVSHGRVGADAVLFAADGAPVLARFGAATLGEPDRTEAALDADADVSADRRAYRALAEQLLVGAGAAADLELVDWPQLPERLFTVAPAISVALDAIENPGHDLRLVGASAVLAERPAPVRAPLRTRGRLDMLLDRLPPTLRVRLDTVAAFLRPVRRRTWVLAASAVGAFVLAIAVVGSLPAGSAETVPAPTTVGETGVPLDAPAPGAEGPESAGDGDDPLVALVALLQARERCLADRSVLCLDAVGQAGSAALADDQQLVRELQQGAETLPPFTVRLDELVLEERLGDSALISIDSPADSEPASVLLMKGEAGWRIRGYLE